MEQMICQSCAMPMENEAMMGTEKDGRLSKDYCTYCYQAGVFNTPDETMEEMIQTCVPHMVEAGFEAQKADQMLREVLPQLKRWKA